MHVSHRCLSVASSRPWSMGRVSPMCRLVVLRPSRVYLAQRTFVTTGPRANALRSRDVNAKSLSGTEGPHLSMSSFPYYCRRYSHKNGWLCRTGDLPPKNISPVEGASQGVTGDWVLFHPVYTPEELRSVQVGIARVDHIVVIHSTSW